MTHRGPFQPRPFCESVICYPRLSPAQWGGGRGGRWLWVGAAGGSPCCRGDWMGGARAAWMERSCLDSGDKRGEREAAALRSRAGCLGESVRLCEAACPPGRDAGGCGATLPVAGEPSRRALRVGSHCPLPSLDSVCWGAGDKLNQEDGVSSGIYPNEQAVPRNASVSYGPRHCCKQPCSSLASSRVSKRQYLSYFKLRALEVNTLHLTTTSLQLPERRL